MTDIASLDRLYQATLENFHALADYIAAGEEALRRLDEETIPTLERAVQASGEMLKAHQLRDLRARRDDLERRVHHLELTRQVAMQSLPSIRLVQENDKALIGKINLDHRQHGSALAHAARPGCDHRAQPGGGQDCEAGNRPDQRPVACER